MFRSHTVLEMSRNFKAFLNLYAGITHDSVPDYDQQAAAQTKKASGQLETLGRAQEQIEAQRRVLERTRGSLVQQNRRTKALQAKLHTSGRSGYSVGKLFDLLLENNADEQPLPLREAIRNLWDEIGATGKSESSRRRLEALQGEKGLKVHLGCGPNIKTGWVNIDLVHGPPAESDIFTDQDTMFINYDLRLGLPLAADSCEFIYSSHFFEHLDLESGLQLMRDCHNALSQGGTFRIVLPNMSKLFDAYLRREDTYFDLLDPYLTTVKDSGTKTRIDYINFAVYQHGEHKYIYDEEKLRSVLEKIGYSSVATSSYREEIDSNLPVRQRYSFYMEATK